MMETTISFLVEGLAVWRMSRNWFEPVCSSSAENPSKLPCTETGITQPPKQVHRSRRWHMKDNGQGYSFLFWQNKIAFTMDCLCQVGLTGRSVTLNINIIIPLVLITNLAYKNSAHGRHLLSWLMRIEAPILKKTNIYLYIYFFFAVEVLLKCCWSGVEVTLQCRWGAIEVPLKCQQPKATATDLPLLTSPLSSVDWSKTVRFSDHRKRDP